MRIHAHEGSAFIVLDEQHQVILASGAACSFTYYIAPQHTEILDIAEYEIIPDEKSIEEFRIIKFEDECRLTAHILGDNFIMIHLCLNVQSYDPQFIGFQISFESLKSIAIDLLL